MDKDAELVDARALIDVNLTPEGVLLYVHVGDRPFRFLLTVEQTQELVTLGRSAIAEFWKNGA